MTGTGIASALRHAGWRVRVTAHHGERLLTATDHRSPVAARDHRAHPGSCWVAVIWPRPGMQPLAIVTALPADPDRFGEDLASDATLELTPGRVLRLVERVRQDRDGTGPVCECLADHTAEVR